MINAMINDILAMYPVIGHFTFPVGPIATAPAVMQIATAAVPNDQPGVFFIYAPYAQAIQHADFLSQRINGLNYTLVYIGKAGMDKAGFNAGGQMLKGRINNVGADNRRRSQIWTDFMVAKALPHLLFTWVVTSKQLNPSIYDNCFFLEAGFYNIWKAIPEFRPKLNI